MPDQRVTSRAIFLKMAKNMFGVLLTKPNVIESVSVPD